MLASPNSSTTLRLFANEQLGQTEAMPAGHSIFDSTAAASHVFYIRRGQVRLYMVSADGSSRLLEILGPGDWFGTAALARLPQQGQRAVAITAATVTTIPVEQLREALRNSPDELLEMTRQLSVKLMAAYESAATLVFDDCHSRLIHTLLRFSTSAASVARDDSVVLHITHEQLAQAVGVARETVSLALTQLRERNLLQTGRNQLLFKPEMLRQFVFTPGKSLEVADEAVESAS